MQFKYIPKKFKGQDVVAFFTINPKEGEMKCGGIAILQAKPDLFSVVRLNAHSIDSDSSWEIGTSGSHGVDWSRAQELFIRRVKDLQS